MQVLPRLSFVEAVKKCLSLYGTFKGRARRSEFWNFYLAYLLYGLAVGLIMPLLFQVVSQSDWTPLVAIFCIAYFIPLIPYLAVMVRRLHDVGKSGWYFCINFIPYIGFIIVILILLGDSQQNENEYGPSPKYVN